MAIDGFFLEPGDWIEIKYRLARNFGSDAEVLYERWFVAQVIECEPEAWPLARLADGQITELRSFMTWRHLKATGPRAVAA
jgi:hypothetical protein